MRAEEVVHVPEDKWWSESLPVKDKLDSVKVSDFPRSKTFLTFAETAR